MTHADTAEFEKAGRGRTDGQMDGQTDGWTDGLMDGWTDPLILSWKKPTPTPNSILMN